MNNGINKLSATETTARQETLYAVAFAIYQELKPDIKREDILNEKRFKEAYNTYVKSDRTSNQVYDFAINDRDGWVDSVVAGINKLGKHRALRTGKFDIFRGEDKMKEVYLEKNRLIDIDDGIPKINDDKWNPGDIWFVNRSFTKNISGAFKTLEEYNLWIREGLMSGRVVGVSLKKSFYPRVLYISNHANIKIYTYYGPKPQESPFNNGITLILSEKHGISNKSIGIRSPSINNMPNGSAITSELDIQGSAARHGKISLADIIKSYNIPQMSISSIISMGFDKQMETVLKLHNDLFGKSFSKEQIKILWEKKLNPSNSNHKIKNFNGYFRSVINSLEVGIYLKSKEGKKFADEIVMRLVRDASSQGKWSSDFLKIM